MGSQVLGSWNKEARADSGKVREAAVAAECIYSTVWQQCS